MKCSASARTSDCPGLGIEDLAGQLQQLLGRGRGRARRGAGGEADRLAGIDVQDEEGLGRLDGPLPAILAVGPHVPLAVAAHAMGIDGQQPAPEVARGAADLAEGDLEVAGSRRPCGPRAVRGRPCRWRGTAGRWPARRSAGSGAAVPQPGAAQRRLVNQLQRQARPHGLRASVPSSRTPGPRPPGGAARGPAARCRPGSP